MDDLISRQAAIDAADAVWSVTGDKNVAKVWDQIKDLPSAQPEMHDKRTESHACDLISRQALCEYALNQKDKNITANDIMRFPSAQPERERGRWIYGEDNLGTGRDGWFCSECGHFELWDYSADMKSAELNLPNYCPNCGADMREVDDERPD